MNLKEQQYVCVLAQCQNLTKAAQALFISQPALSIYINNLESNLGVKLFERIGKRFVALTGISRKSQAIIREGCASAFRPDALPGSFLPSLPLMRRNFPIWM